MKYSKKTAFIWILKNGSIDNYIIQLNNGHMLVKRLFSQNLQEAINSFPAILITGPKQSGKTTFAQQELPG